MSRPSTSMSLATRSPIVASITLRMTKLATPDQTIVASVPRNWIQTWPADGDAVGEADAAEGLADEDARQDGADEPADAVHAEGVERIVVAELRLQRGGRPAADRTGGDADDEGARRADEAGSRSDGDETGDRARDDAEDARLAVAHPFDEHPGERGGRSRDLGDRHRHAGDTVGRKFRAGIEAEPADPQQRGADQREHEVVRCHVLRAVALALAEDEGADEARPRRH